MLSAYGTLDMKSSAYVFAALLVSAPLSAYADAADVNDCKRIENAAERLVCYDELFKYSTTDTGGDTDSALTRPESPEDSSDLHGESAAIAEFGAEQIQSPPVSSVEARLVGDFNGWSGKTVFALDNGQVWRQTNNNIRDYTPRSPIPQPKVTISKGMFGSYNMQVDGVKRIVQVKRVK